MENKFFNIKFNLNLVNFVIKFNLNLVNFVIKFNYIDKKILNWKIKDKNKLKELNYNYLIFFSFRHLR